MPRYTGAINAALTIMPRRVSAAIQRAMGADNVLMNVDRTARARYDSRVGGIDADDSEVTPTTHALGDG